MNSSCRELRTQAEELYQSSKLEKAQAVSFDISDKNGSMLINLTVNKYMFVAVFITNSYLKTYLRYLFFALNETASTAGATGEMIRGPNPLYPESALPSAISMSSQVLFFSLLF